MNEVRFVITGPAGRPCQKRKTLVLANFVLVNTSGRADSLDSDKYLYPDGFVQIRLKSICLSISVMHEIINKASQQLVSAYPAKIRG